jgi:nicotinamide-nucleotide amidase
MMAFDQRLVDDARRLLDLFRSHRLRLVTAESCTGGLLAALLTEIAGSSEVFERGHVTYSNAAKMDLLGVPEALITEFGAVSGEVALAMAEGALSRSPAEIAVSITGIAGPDGGTKEKPVGLVHLASVGKGRPPIPSRLLLTGRSRSEIRTASVAEALRLLRAQVAK